LPIQPRLASQTATPACDRIAKSSTEDESPVDRSQKHKFSVRTPLKKAETVEKLPRCTLRLLAQLPCHHLSEWLDDKLATSKACIMDPLAIRP
jgi:hypothetical protein